MKHKHAEIIKAWADGAQIEFFTSDEFWEDTKHPQWHEDMEYRIKHKPDIAFYCETYFDKKPVKTPMHPIWLTTDNLRLIYDGETGKLKKAEILE